MSDHHARRTRRRPTRRNASTIRRVGGTVSPLQQSAWREVQGDDARLSVATLMDLVLDLADRIDHDQQRGTIGTWPEYTEVLAVRDVIDRLIADEDDQESGGDDPGRSPS